ncbi:MAG: hypothetical protein ABID38_04135 [Candidatus Diapherotrites archaeon]
MNPSLESKEDIVKKIVSAGKSKESVEKKISDKMEKFSGLLSEQGAAFMVAKEMGVELSGGGSKRIKISDLKEGMNGISLSVRAKQIFQPKGFEKGGKSGKLCSLIIDDDSGEMRLTIWNDDVDKLNDLKIERGSIIMLKGCYTKSFNDKLQMNLGKGGQLLLDEKQKLELPEAESKTLNLNELVAGFGDVDVFARIAAIFEAREFSSEKGSGKVGNFLLADEKGRCRAAAWNEMVDVLKELSVGDLVKVEGAYTKEGLQGVELNLGWKARILKNPKREMPALAELSAENAEEKKINQIVGNEMVKITGKIGEIRPGKLHYLVCEKCGKSVSQIGENYICEKCGEVKNPKKKALVKVEIEDDTASIGVVGFGGDGEKLLGLDNNEFRDLLERKNPEDIVEELLPKLKEKEITIVGRVKKNMFGDDEIVVSRVG